MLIIGELINASRRSIAGFIEKKDSVILADDIAFNSGLMTRPAVLREYFFPSLSRQTAAAAEHNLLAFCYSDGNYRNEPGWQIHYCGEV